MITTITLILVAALLPVMLLFKYITEKDSDNPEPRKWLLKAVWYGVLSAIIVLVVHMFIPDSQMLYPQYQGSVWGAILMALWDAAIPEEAAKLLMIILLVRKNPYFDEHLDGIVYATCIGLGFAGLENILYVSSNLNNLVGIAISRALFAVPGHFFFAVVMGYFLSLASFESTTPKERTGYMILAYLVPVALHATYDGILMVAEVAQFGGGMLFIIFLWFCNKMRKRGIRRIAEMKEMDKVSIFDFFRG